MSENDNNFEALRRLLALKRHEIPPPGYFENFSGDVIARIRAEQSTARLPWLLRFLHAFESRPAYPVAFASTLCFLLLFGIVSIEQSPEASLPTGFASQNPSFFADASGSSPTPSISQPVRVMDSTNPPTSLTASSPVFFNSQPNPTFQQVGFATGN